MTSNKQYIDMKLTQEEINIAKELSNIVLNDEKFSIWSASSEPNQHHYGKGGLKTHTNEVLNLMILVSSNLKLDLDYCLIELSALYHDIGKLYDYTPKDNDFNEWKKTDHCREINHLSKSAIIWNINANKLNFPTKYIDQITHAILAHHGHREYGSPVAPKSKLSWLLHLCDNLSAKMDCCAKMDSIKR
jgi:3'-5' exoribonuclease